MPRLFPSLLAAALVLALPAGAQNRAPAGPVPTGYVVLEQSVVPVRSTLTGRAVARSAAQLRPRVGGTITEIPYTPGTQVQAGTPLFTIDPLTYEVALAGAAADHAAAAAALQSAGAAHDRATRLREANAGSQAAYDEALAALRRARAAMDAAEASLTLAKAQLEWTTVRAPIPGVVGLPQVSVGDLVTQGQTTALAEIVQSDPILIDLTEPYTTRLRIESRAAAGEITLFEAPALSVVLGDGRRLDEPARLVSAGTRVSATTGSRILRFELPNARGLVAPGMFIHAELTLGFQNAILVPQRAASRERDGSLTAWIARDGRAEKRAITETGSHDGAWVVTAGVQPGEWLLIDGTANLRDGAPVSPVPATIDAQGVVRDIAAQAGAERVKVSN